MYMLHKLFRESVLGLGCWVHHATTWYSLFLSAVTEATQRGDIIPKEWSCKS